MQIYIVTAGRPEIGPTEDALRKSELPYFIVAPYGEVTKGPANVVWTPPTIKGIADKRRWIMWNYHAVTFPDDPKLVMLDDDLSFWERSPNGHTFARIEDLHGMMASLDMMLTNYAHGGVAGKYMSQSKPREYEENSKYYHVLAYNLDLFQGEKLYGRVEGHEDHDLNLQLLKAGKPNFVLTEWAHSDIAFAPGGCSAWRTPESDYREVLKFRDLHPDVVMVRPVEGNPKKLYGLKIRWKLAAKMGGIYER